MKKTESIVKMRNLGLNVLDCLITDSLEEARAFIIFLADDSGVEKVSIRTERGYEFGCPFLYGKNPIELLGMIDDLVNKGYTLIIYPYLDWKASVAYGTVAFPRDGRIIAEYVLAPGLVRELDNHKDKKVEILNPGKYRYFREKLTNEVLKKLLDLELYELEESMVYEWSYYERPVGELDENLIFWEMRAYD